MGRVTKIHGFNAPRLGRMGDNIVVRWQEALLIVFPGSRAWDYLADIPPDDWDVDYAPQLFTRFTPNISYPEYWVNDYMHCLYWDAAVVVGLHPGVVVALPNSDEVQRALILGKASVMELFPELEKLKRPNWISEVNWHIAEAMEVPDVHWTRHTF
jgi:hypothetical protein